jgi:cellulose synthase/poly-beta-1,6-N-acetylglucosamine synthase-like glycosyltransferase
MDFLTSVFLVYSFVAFYFLFLFVLIYFQNKKNILTVPKITKKYDISVVITCFNEGATIGKAIDNLTKNGYSGLKKIIVVDDCSTDGSWAIIKKYEKKYPGLVMAVQTPKNTGNAAGGKNYGSKFVKTELIAFSDGDSFPEKGSIEKTIGFFDDLKVGAVTSTVLVKNRTNLLLRLQAIEYIIIKFTRKLLEFIGSIYVTPGPLAVYRRSAFEKIGKFDQKNLTEDIEITWRLLYNGFDVKMSVPSKVYSIAPDKFRGWFRQRIRWNKGGVQTMIKYGSSFFRRGMLGAFVLPFFVFSWFLGVFGLAILVYRLGRAFIVRYLLTTYSVHAHAAVLTLKDFNLTPSILIFMGLVLFTLSLTFSIIALLSIKEKKEFKRPNVFVFLIYEFFYLLTYPVILVVSAWELFRGRKTWS